MLLNGELEVDFPDGFHELSAEETGKLKLTEAGPGVVLSDPERHIMVSVGWKKIGALAGLLLNEGDLAGKMEKSLESSMAQFGYQAIGKPKKNLGGETAQGICYRYVTQGIGMQGESLVLKHKKTLYYFHYYTRETLAEEDRPVWEQVLGSVRWR